jgi:conserved oligomeric Golgi complex subunit 5
VWNHNFTLPELILRKKIKDTFESITQPIMSGLRRDLGAIISRMHKLDFGKGLDESISIDGTNMYMKNLSERLVFIRNDVLLPINTGDTNKERYVQRFDPWTFLHI